MVVTKLAKTLDYTYIMYKKSCEAFDLATFRF